MENNQDLITQDQPQEENNFIAELEVMDLSSLKDKMYLVAVATGERNSFRFLCSTVKGPYNFVEMCEEVGTMWHSEQHHARVIILSKDRDKRAEVLDENTTDYIECHYLDIISKEFIDGILLNEEYTCTANIVSHDKEKLDADI